MVDVALQQRIRMRERLLVEPADVLVLAATVEAILTTVAVAVAVAGMAAVLVAQTGRQVVEVDLLISER
jgi:hypothetical protein